MSLGGWESYSGFLCRGNDLAVLPRFFFGYWLLGCSLVPMSSKDLTGFVGFVFVSIGSATYMMVTSLRFYTLSDGKQTK